MPSPEAGGEWGILGGNFDPVHSGHINLALQIIETKKLNGVLFVPSFRHPLKHKACEASYSDRVTMLKLALAESGKLQLCEIESDESLSGYTIDTVLALKKRYRRATLRFIIGSDNVSQVRNWRRADELLKEIRFVAGSRPGDIKSGEIEIVNIPEKDISSHRIRNMIKSGVAVSDLTEYLPAKVAEYIFEKKLYR